MQRMLSIHQNNQRIRASAIVARAGFIYCEMTTDEELLIANRLEGRNGIA